MRRNVDKRFFGRGLVPCAPSPFSTLGVDRLRSVLIVLG